jgi:hypothetical protein
MNTRLAWMITLTLGVTACAESNGDDAGDDAANDGGEEICDAPLEASFPAADESSCTPAATDYQPLTNADGDGFPACSTDDGDYHLIDSTPSSIARVEAFETIMGLLGPDATPDDFTEARTVYSQDEGLESRLQRREDLFYPPIPESDWMEGVDPDKQCTVEANVTKYADRCAGPAKLGPMMNEAFAAGQTGEGDPAILTARIEAIGLWFFYLSTYKEANTCLLKAKDCDSSWAYYTGGTDRSGGLGLSAEVRALSTMANDRVWDGFTAVRCFRELYPIEDYPTREDLDADGEALATAAYDQLARSLHYAYARVVRARLENQDMVCGTEAQANWAFLQIAGPVLDREASVRDPATAETLSALWALEEPTAADLEAGVAAIDTIFGCP